MTLKREEAYHKIRDAILFDNFRPGERLVESELTDQFGLGRMPVREALRQLESEGYIEVTPHKGAVIRKISLQEVEDTYDALAALEGHAVESSVPHLKASELAELEKINDILKIDGNTRNIGNWFEHNSMFHAFFYRHGRNAIVENMITALRNRIYRYRILTATLNKHVDRYLEAHERIFTAVMAMNPQAAGQAMRDHMQDVRSGVSSLLRDMPWL